MLKLICRAVLEEAHSEIISWMVWIKQCLQTSVTEHPGRNPVVYGYVSEIARTL